MDADDTRRLCARLCDRDPRVRRQAREAVDVVDSDVLMVLWAVFREEALAHAWPDCLALLMNTGFEAVKGSGRSEFDVYDSDKFDTLVGTLSDAPPDMVIRGRLAATLGLRPGTRLSWLTTDAGPGPAPGIDGGGVLPAPDLPDHYVKQAPVMVALLASEVDWMRRKAEYELYSPTLIYPQYKDTLPEMLRAMRRSRMPRRARRAALRMLADIAWHGIEPADRAALQRLIRIKLRYADVPEPVDMDASWYALPTSDQAAVLDAFGLCDSVPVTMRMGFAAFDGWHAEMYSNQMFVSPALDGWTLVIFDHPLIGDSYDDQQRRCAELSRRFGAAHWYTQAIAGGCDDHSGWCVAEGGTILAQCFYDHSGQGAWTGPPDPASGRTPTIDELRAWVDEHDHQNGRPPDPPQPPLSRGEREEHELDGQDKTTEMTDVFGIDPSWELEVLKVAWRLSVCPKALGPHTRVEGTGVMAVPAGTGYQRCGVLPIGDPTSG